MKMDAELKLQVGTGGVPLPGQFACRCQCSSSQNTPRVPLNEKLAVMAAIAVAVVCWFCSGSFGAGGKCRPGVWAQVALTKLNKPRWPQYAH